MTKTIVVICLLIAFTATLSHSEIVVMPLDGQRGVWMPMEDYDELILMAKYENKYLGKSLSLCEKSLKGQDFYRILAWSEAGVIVVLTALTIIQGVTK